MIYKQILMGFLAQAHKSAANGELIQLLEKGELTEEQGKEALSKILELDSNKVASIRAEGEKKFQDGYAKSKGEVLSNFEKEIFEAYPDADKNLKGLDLIKSLNSDSKNGTTSITDADVQSHQAYLAMERRLKDEANQLVAAKDSEIAKLLNDTKREKVFGTIESKMFSLRDKLNAVIPKEANIAQTTQRNLLRELKEHDFDVKEDGTILILKDGKPLQDNHGNTVDFESFGKNILNNYYAYSDNNGGASSGSGKEGSGSGSPAVGKKFNTANELQDYLYSEGVTLEQKQAALEANPDL